MNLELFIAKKITSKDNEDGSFSHPIISIAKLSISLGICVMILAVAIVTGFKAEVRNKVTGFSSHIQITNYDNNSSFETQPVEKSFVPIEMVKNTDGVSHIQAFVTKPALITTGKDFQGVVFHGIGMDYDWTFFNENLKEGEVFQLADSVKSNKTIISAKLADLLHLKVGDKITASFIQNPPRHRRLTISGIYKTGMEEFDKLFLLCDMRHLQKVNGWDDSQVSGYEIFINDFNKIQDIEYSIRRICANNYTQEGAGLKVSGIHRKYRQIFSWLEMLDINVWIILSLMILVAGFNMISGLLIIILERTSMIGILKALGTRNWTIRKVFLYQASMIIGKGMLWGNVLGVSICLIQYYFEIIPLDPTSYYVDTVPINFNLIHLLLLNVGALIATVAMLLVPSYLITRINPVKAIQFD